MLLCQKNKSKTKKTTQNPTKKEKRQKTPNQPNPQTKKKNQTTTPTQEMPSPVISPLETANWAINTGSSS